MENIEEKKELTQEEELKGRLVQAFNQLKVLTDKNYELNQQNTMLKVSDFYQRANFLWTFIKEGKDLFPSEFIDKCVNDIIDMFTIKDEEPAKQEGEEKEGK
ncbi:MAG: hypothetical protein IJ565_00745 [Bacilli bacterium]|nr:hypothetical protein [Bacilli bacterium]